jgi:hypothetical protein
MTKTFVIPENLEGSIEHYFHFMFGYLIPFVSNADPSQEYIFADCGPHMNRFLISIPGYRTEIHSDAGGEVSAVRYKGHDSKDFPGLDIESVRRRMFDVFGVGRESEKTVVVVDRADPHSFYETDAKIRGSGNSRRSIPNMTEVFEEVKSVFDSATFVRLESLTIRDQMELFRDASCVVMQHGAAMANLIWCEKGASVVEIRSDFTVDYFKKMVDMAGLNRVRIKQEHDHACVSPKEVLKGLLNGFSKIM